MRPLAGLGIALLLTTAACAPSTHSASPPPGSAGRVVAEGVASDSPLMGTWELVSSRVTRGDSVVADVRSPDVRQLKVLSRTHFSFVSVQRDTQFLRAAAGRYTATPRTATEGRYTEMSEIGSSRGFRNRIFEFTYRLEGDLWHHSGGAGGLARIDEIWRRVR